MAVRRVEKAYEKHAWIILFALGILWPAMSVPLLLGVDPDTTEDERIMGTTFSEVKASNPGFFDLVTFYLRLFGLFWLAFGLLLMAISVTAYRRGQKWAWYALWVLPLIFIGWIAIDPLTLGESTGAFMLSSLIVSLIGLLLPYRKFFPRK